MKIDSDRAIIGGSLLGIFGGCLGMLLGDVKSGLLYVVLFLIHLNVTQTRMEVMAAIRNKGEQHTDDADA